MKKTLLGLANNIAANIHKIKLWAISFRKYSDAQIVLLAANSNEDERKMCEEFGITIVPVAVENPGEINHKRLNHVSNFLKTSDIDLVLITDVYDVAFQGDPFAKMETEKYDIFVSGEGVLVKHEMWNFDNISKLFPNEIEKCINTEVINSGIIGGKRQALIPLYERMYELCEKYSTNKHNIKDQAALIVMISNKEIPNLKIFNLDDGWAMHCAVAGPTQFFISWGFVNNIMYGIPKIEDGYIVNKFNNRYDLVHQFNRVPEWHEIVKNNNI